MGNHGNMGIVLRTPIFLFLGIIKRSTSISSFCQALPWLSFFSPCTSHFFAHAGLQMRVRPASLCPYAPVTSTPFNRNRAYGRDAGSVGQLRYTNSTTRRTSHNYRRQGIWTTKALITMKFMRPIPWWQPSKLWRWKEKRLPVLKQWSGT